MRFLLLPLLLLLAIPASAQLRFTASPVEQRLDSAEQRLDTLESTVKQLAETNHQIVALLAKQAAPAKPVQPVVEKPAPQLVSVQPAKPVRVVQPAQSSYAAIVRSHFPNGWRGEYADVSPRSAVYIHLQQHGFSASDIQGLDQNTALGLHALAHAGLVRPGQYSTPQENRVRTAPVQQMGGCANGQCARPGVSYSQRRSGVFGFGIFR